jgi:hypothetical protein
MNEDWDMRDLPPWEIPTKVLEYLRYQAKEGETYKGFTLTRTRYVKYPCGYESITLYVRLPTGEEVEV